jgi:hypothetical protein
MGGYGFTLCAISFPSLKKDSSFVTVRWISHTPAGLIQVSVDRATSSML